MESSNVGQRMLAQVVRRSVRWCVVVIEKESAWARRDGVSRSCPGIQGGPVQPDTV